MVDYNAPLYQHAPEVWDEKTCAKKAKSVAKDGHGTQYPFKGKIGSHYGEKRFNGGCIRNGEWWQGENYPFPQIPDTYEIVPVQYWDCYQIRKKKK